MKKMFVVMSLLLLATSVANAQSVMNASIKRPKKDKHEIKAVYSKNHRSRGGGRYSNTDSYGYGGRRNNYITLENIEVQFKQMEGRIKDSDKYGDVKKLSLLNELNRAYRKIEESDVNGDAILNRKEQRVYKDYYMER